MSERPLFDPLPRRILDLQRQAADPASSIWVEANAGSGKTRVLTDRVLRLLLSGVAPDQILCLTYTRAAAAEMRQRLSARLAAWALSEDAGLSGALAALLDAPVDGATLARARTLFATALETPGGLRIQTIHAFCESLLHRFPVEAGVPVNFQVVDDFERQTMILAAREQVIAAGINGDPALERPVEVLFDALSDFAITSAIDLALSENARLQNILADRDGAKLRLRRLVKARPGEDSATIGAEIVARYPFGTAEHDQVFSVCPPRPGGSRFEDRLAGLSLQALTVEALFETYLTKDGDVPRSFPKKDIAARLPGLAPRLLAEADRLARQYGRLTRARLVERSEALLDVLGAISDRYEAAKRARSLLDFDDLVARLRRLLGDRAQGDWVRYKLDGGLTHILVDESQDTNPEQWQVIDALVAEFFEPGGIERHRTLFAVGDGKQSIYSFQGAEPQLFIESGRKYSMQALAAQRRFARVRLDTSFRTLPGVLDAVDAVFRDEQRRAAVLEELVIAHKPARRDQGGTVTLWPPLREPEEVVDPHNWPTEIPADTRSATRRVAERIAAEIAAWVRQRRPLAARGRAVRPDDVLILVQSRSSLFHEIIRALHRAGLQTPGADRLAVASHIGVLDLLALGDVLLNTADDLQLAALLRSPLLGLSEDELFELAGPRASGQTLWQALRGSAEPRAAAAHARLQAWRRRLDFDRPYEFFARVLYAEGGLRAFHRRFGREVDDVLAEFLELALAHEQTPQPSLQGFLAAMRAREVTIKRELGEQGGGVRVMTVHGAKGLEAPIVILADAASRPDGRRTSRPVYLPVDAPGPLLLHAPSKALHVPESLALRAAEAERQQAEYWRKLYVAMTRAEDELYVTGALTSKARLEGTWYEAVADSLAPLAETCTDADGEVTAMLYPRERPPPVPATAAEGGVSAAAPVAAPLQLAPLAPPLAVPVVRPSAAFVPSDMHRALETAAEAAVDAELARRKGLALHALLQHLGRVPPPERHRIAARALPVLLPDVPAEHPALLHKALSILGRPEFAHLFGPDSRAEVPFLAEARRDGSPIRLAGRIDRLVVGPDRVLVVDFKSDAAAPTGPDAVPDAYLVQLGLYALVAGQLFPGRHVAAAILWTSLESLLELPGERVAGSVRSFTVR